MENCVFRFADVWDIKIILNSTSSLKLLNSIHLLFTFFLHLLVHVSAEPRHVLMDKSLNFSVDNHLHIGSIWFREILDLVINLHTTVRLHLVAEEWLRRSFLLRLASLWRSSVWRSIPSWSGCHVSLSGSRQSRLSDWWSPWRNHLCLFLHILVLLIILNTVKINH